MNVDYKRKCIIITGIKFTSRNAKVPYVPLPLLPPPPGERLERLGVSTQGVMWKGC